MDESQKRAMEIFVRRLPPGRNTASYYAMDLGLDRVKWAKKKRSVMGKDPGSKFYVIMLTDGLDNVSTKVASNHRQGKYASGEDYAKALQTKMSKIMGNSPNSFQSYPLLFFSDDLRKIQQQSNLSEKDFETYLDKKLAVFAGAQNAVRPKVIMGSDFLEIIEEFVNQFLTASFDFYIPKDYAGKRVRMTLLSDNDDEAYFEGDFVKKGNAYTFENIQYSKGLSGETRAGNTLKMKNPKDKKNILSLFSINSLNLNGTPYKVHKAGQQIQDSGIWAVNSEYNAQSGTMKNAYIMVILDGSDSFKNAYTDAQETILEIVDFITEK
ncbi:MAG: hypothetical protein LBH52_04710 [Puniceicoccales bacterium]|nr:hypothetical protein [Puniceicoccales bacterium]